MPTFYIHTPSPASAFSFQPTLDGVVYTAVVTWNFVSRRYYLNLYSLSRNRILTIPVIGSLDSKAIVDMYWANGLANLQTKDPHGFVTDATIDVVVSGMVPDMYNGNFRAYITGRDTIQYPCSMSTYVESPDPYAPLKFGSVSYEIDLVAGYFKTSKMIFRQASNRFEVTP